MILTYSYKKSTLPTLYVLVECAETGKKRNMPMLIDTGSCYTCLPKFMVPIFGMQDHKNSEEPAQGIGCQISRYLHPIKMGLIDPKKTKAIVAWESPLEKVSFIDELRDVRGILGMDVISLWKEFCLVPYANDDRYGGEVRISV